MTAFTCATSMPAVVSAFATRQRACRNWPSPPRRCLRASVTGILELLLEPGRSIVGNAGVLLTRVEYVKQGSERRFALVDAAMNDLLRPALYDAWHEIVPVSQQRSEVETALYDVVGPVCESGDFLGRERALQISPGDLLAVRSAGAYGFVMSSNYNTRPRPAEVVVDGDRVHLARPRERVEELFASERLLSA